MRGSSVKKWLKTTLSFVMTLSVLSGTIPIADIPLEVYAQSSGTCGEDLTWTLDDGLLTISGAGEMSETPWDADEVIRVKFESGVIDIEVGVSYWLQECPNLLEINVAEGNPCYASENGVLFSKDKSELIAYPAGKSGSYEIPNTVTSIEYGAFNDCSLLTSITIPESVDRISSQVFSGCSSLAAIIVDEDNEEYSSEGGILFSKDKSGIIRCPSMKSGNYIIPNSVVDIMDGAFEGCDKLTSITLPDGIAYIGMGAFQNCSGLLSMEIPNGIEELDVSVFAGCTALTSVSIPDSVTGIDHQAFEDCTSLTSITIPKNLNGIRTDAFSGCSSLMSFVVDPDNETYTSEDGVMFAKDKSSLRFYPAGKEGAYTIPDRVENIEDFAFYECNKLTGITIPNGVTRIGNWAFVGCTGLTEIILPASLTGTIGTSAFWGCNGLTSIVIPDGVTGFWRSTFAECSNLTNITIPASVTKIGYETFSDCNKLKDIYYGGTEEDWNKIDIETEGNDILNTATIHFTEKAAVSVNEVTLTPTTLDLKVGESGNLTATVIPENATNKKVTWTSSAAEIATVDAGKVTAVAPGEAVITVKTEDGDKTASCTVTVTAQEVIALTGITLDKIELTLLEGEKQAINISFAPENASNKNVTWSSSDATIASVTNGEVTAIKEGSAVIKAVSEDGEHEATCKVTVKKKEGPLGPEKADLSKYTASGNEIAVKSINLKKSIFADTKGIKKFDVTAGDKDSVKIKGSTLTVLKNGTVTVAAFNKSKEKIAEKTISVIAPAVETTQPTEINRRGNIDLNKYVNSTVKPSKWKSSGKKIAEVTQDGLLTIKKSGTVKLTATFPSEKGMKAKTLTIKLKIKMPQFKKSSYTVKVGKTKSTAVKNADATEITYRTEDAAIATVDAQGVVTGVSKGTTKLFMTVKGIDYETTIKVK